MMVGGISLSLDLFLGGLVLRMLPWYINHHENPPFGRIDFILTTTLSESKDLGRKNRYDI